MYRFLDLFHSWKKIFQYYFSAEPLDKSLQKVFVIIGIHYFINYHGDTFYKTHGSVFNCVVHIFLISCVHGWRIAIITRRFPYRRNTGMQHDKMIILVREKFSRLENSSLRCRPLAWINFTSIFLFNPPQEDAGELVQEAFDRTSAKLPLHSYDRNVHRNTHRWTLLRYKPIFSIVLHQGTNSFVFPFHQERQSMRT